MRICTCDASKKVSTPCVISHLPTGWQMMSQSQREADTWIECAHCHKILKHFGTVFHGDREYTLPMIATVWAWKK